MCVLKYKDSRYPYLEVIRDLDHVTAKEWCTEITNVRQSNGYDLEAFAKIIGYPKNNVWQDGEVSPYLRKLLTLLKILATAKTLPKCKLGILNIPLPKDYIFAIG